MTCFNPTLVRLRLRGRDVVIAPRAGFNPTLVRLRRFHLTSGNINAIMFQSHAGSIEAQGPAGDDQGGRRFQSHAGSIEARAGGGSSILLAVSFQSHAGSIEAQCNSRANLGGTIVSIPRWFD